LMPCLFHRPANDAGGWRIRDPLCYK
jgi:hypothetical protein